MNNAIILFSMGLLEVLILLNFARLRHEWILKFVVINLLLITIFGAKFVPVGQFAINTGSIFCTAAMLAIYLLIELGSEKLANESIWIATVTITHFIVVSQFVISLNSTPDTALLSEALQLVFTRGLRIALASLFAFAVTLRAMVWLYSTLRAKTKGRKLWLRIILTTAIVQVVDTILFFTIAFLGTMASSTLWNLIIPNYIAKMLFCISMIPLIYITISQSKRSFVKKHTLI